MRVFFQFMRRVTYSLYFYAVFLLVLESYYVYGRLTCGKDPVRWRQLCVRAVRHILSAARIRYTVTGLAYLPPGTAIFCANHQSYLDGLLIFAATGRPFVAITAPFEVFPGIVERWFRRMHYIPVARTVFEELKYKDALRHQDIVNATLRRLQQGVSILLFPEGTRERSHRLLPFHTGVARMAIGSRAPVVPITLKNVDRLFPSNSIWLNRTPVQIVISPPVQFAQAAGASDALASTAHLEDIIRHHLPQRYFTTKSVPSMPTGVRAAFFDIDGTLTRHNLFEIAMLRHLRAQHDVRAYRVVPKLLYRQLLSSHGSFYSYAVAQLRGIEAASFLGGLQEAMEEYAQKIFYTEIRALLEEHRVDGNKIFLVTEEPTRIARLVGQMLNVQGFGTSVEVVSGRFTGRIRGHIMKDEAKKDMLIDLARRHRIDLSKSYAYGNSWHDYPMLRVVGHPVLVRPPASLARRGRELGFQMVSRPQ